ncbi:hypothetical protein ACOSQ3_002452 [Xanthoceras sorbifolium]
MLPLVWRLFMSIRLFSVLTRILLFFFSNPKESVVHEVIFSVGTILGDRTGASSSETIVESGKVKRWKRLAREKVKGVCLDNKLVGLGKRDDDSIVEKV